MASPLPYEYSYISSQPHINCYHHTCLMKASSVLPNVTNRQHPCLPSKKGRWLDGKPQTIILQRFLKDIAYFYNYKVGLPSRRWGLKLIGVLSSKLLSINNPYHSCSEVVFQIALVISLFHIDRCIHSNSYPNKHYPTNSTIGSLLS